MGELAAMTLAHAAPVPKITRDSSHLSAVARRAPLRGRLLDTFLGAFRMQLLDLITGAASTGRTIADTHV